MSIKPFFKAVFVSAVFMFGLCGFASAQTLDPNETLDISNGHTNLDSYGPYIESVNLSGGSAEISGLSSIGTLGVTTGRGVLKERWTEKGLQPSRCVDKKIEFSAPTGTLNIGDLGNFKNNGAYIGKVTVDGPLARFTNGTENKTRDEVEDVYKWTTTPGANVFTMRVIDGIVTNSGSIGKYSGQYNYDGENYLGDRSGGLVLDKGIVTNYGYISIADVNGGGLFNYTHIAEVYQTGGIVQSWDWIEDVRISGGKFYNEFNKELKFGAGSGGGVDHMVISGDAVVVNRNYVGDLEMSGGVFQYYRNNKDKVVNNATISGGEIFGDGLFGKILIKDGGNLDIGISGQINTGFTGSINYLSFENGGSLTFKVLDDSTFSILNIGTGGILDLTNAAVNISFDNFFDDWDGFDLSKLFNLGDGASILGDLEASLSRFTFEGLGIFGTDWKFDSFLLTKLNSSTLGDASGNGLGNTNSPEPASVLMFGFAALFAVPVAIRSRKKFK